MYLPFNQKKSNNFFFFLKLNVNYFRHFNLDILIMTNLISRTSSESAFSRKIQVLDLLKVESLAIATIAALLLFASRVFSVVELRALRFSFHFSFSLIFRFTLSFYFNFRVLPKETTRKNKRKKSALIGGGREGAGTKSLGF